MYMINLFMNRRNLLASTAVAASTLLAGCSSDSSTDTNDTETDTDGSPDVLSSDSAVTHLETTYEAWVTMNADAFLATLHSTNNHPEEEVRSSASDIDFEGELVALNAEVLDENLDSDAISTFFESGPNLSDQDVSTFTDVRNLTIKVNPTVDGETTTEGQENIKTFFETEKSHFLAVENEEWRFVL